MPAHITINGPRGTLLRYKVVKLSKEEREKLEALTGRKVKSIVLQLISIQLPEGKKITRKDKEFEKLVRELKIEEVLMGQIVTVCGDSRSCY